MKFLTLDGSVWRVALGGYKAEVWLCAPGGAQCSGEALGSGATPEAAIQSAVAGLEFPALAEASV